jgi:TPR repeat protein
MPFFNRDKSQPPADDDGEPTSAAAAVHWSDIDSIRGEWPRATLDPAADLARFRQALVIFERDDYTAMMQCATLFATALAHFLYGPGILHGNDVPETVHKALYCSLCPPPDGRTFAESAQRAARLAMTIMRENGWQPSSLGGTRTDFAPMMSDKGNQMLLTAAVSPPGHLQPDGLRAFFSVPPQSAAGPRPDSATGTIGRVHAILQESEAGDAASSLYLAGLALAGRGDKAGALAKFSAAAALGSADAMEEAGDLSKQLGRPEEANAWYKRAAQAGHPVGMFNSAIADLQQGRQASALEMLQRAAEAGNAEGYAALAQLARDAGDEAAESNWARLGAEAGHPFCMGRHGLLLARAANGDVPMTRRARDYLEQAAERGDLDSASLAINLSHQLGDPARAQRFVALVMQSGDQNAIGRLRRYGFS